MDNYLQRAKDYYQQGAYRSAERKLKKAPDSAEKFYYLALVYLQQKEPQKATQFFNQSAELNYYPSQVYLLNEQSQKCMALEQRKQGYQFFYTHLENQNHEAAFSLAMLLYLIGNEAIAETLLLSASQWGNQQAQGLLQTLEIDAANTIDGDFLKPLKETLSSIDLAKQTIKQPKLNQLSNQEFELSYQLVENIIPPIWCHYLIQLFTPWVKKSKVIDPVTGKTKELAIRTSSNTTFNQLYPSFLLAELEEFVCQQFNLSRAMLEPVNVLEYKPGQEYKPHTDSVPNSDTSVKHFGQRSDTVILYLNDCQQGGETCFTKFNHQIPSKSAQAVHFKNCDSQGKGLLASQHASLPVIQGEKMVCTFWFRQKKIFTMR